MTSALILQSISTVDVAAWVRRKIQRYEEIRKWVDGPVAEIIDRFREALLLVQVRTAKDLVSALTVWLQCEINEASETAPTVSECLTDALEFLDFELEAAPWVDATLSDACFSFKFGDRIIYVAV